MDPLGLVIQLTEHDLPADARIPALRQFADANGWRPSDALAEYPRARDAANGHLLVEHGLTNTAVITFCRRQSYRRLPLSQQLQLLALSYNYLVDWHLFPEPDGLTAVFNRAEPPHATFVDRAHHPDVWMSSTFDRIASTPPSASHHDLEDALVETVSFWKRAIASEIADTVPNEHLSVLLNTILFVRSFEDYRRWHDGNSGRLLLDLLIERTSSHPTARDILKEGFERLGSKQFPPFLQEQQQLLRTFDSLHPSTLIQLFRSFYDNRFAPYIYDFHLISKHALSRIYEHYVSLLRTKESPQMLLFRELPDELSKRAIGAIYTPHYIARFFSRFLKENLTPPSFRRLKTIDPACGSGIFLRTILEMQCDPLQDADVTDATAIAFSNATGVDVDPNACQATRLSLSLLHLALTGRFPDSLDVQNEEALAFWLDRQDLQGKYDAVVANPPFIKWENLTPVMQDRVRTVMGDSSSGRFDLFIGFLEIAQKWLRPGGFLLFVVPHSFLIAKSAHELRTRIASTCTIRILADLSEIPVFENVGAYVVLLILETRKREDEGETDAVILKCREAVGHALRDAIDGKEANNDFYQIFTAPQSYFDRDAWSILTPDQMQLQAELDRHPVLSDAFDVRQGFVTGADEVFVRPISAVPKAERNVWIPYLPDREMLRYAVPRRAKSVVFYPFEDGERLGMSDIREYYPETWEYLKQNKRLLKSRRAVLAKTCEWWSPERPRSPRYLLRPKIVTPHLVLSPRFSLDAKGRFGVSRSPFVIAREEGQQLEALRYALAVLNSPVGYWQIAMHSHRYSRGYAMLEVKTLSKLRIPNPAEVDPVDMKRIQGYVVSRMMEEGGVDDSDLDKLIVRLYGLTEQSARLLSS